MKNAHPCRQKRNRTTLELFVRKDPTKPQRKVLRKGRQPEPPPKRVDDRTLSLESKIQALKDENQSLKSENEALKRKFLKEYACSICEKSYKRSDGLFKHLWQGDEEHKSLARERYSTRCGKCGKECRTWLGLQRHTNARHAADNLLDSDFDGSSHSPKPSSIASQTEAMTSSATSLADNNDSELNETYLLEDRSMLDSTDITQSMEDVFSPSTPPPVAIRESSSILCGESPGFSDNPVHPLNSATHGQPIPFFYDGTAKEAPSFANNPACQLNYVAPRQMLPSLYDANTTETSSLVTTLMYPTNYVVPGQTLPSYYNATNAEAPSFIASPAYPLNNSGSWQATPLLYNTFEGEAPILSNEAFSLVHPSPGNTASWGTPVLSCRRGHP